MAKSFTLYECNLANTCQSEDCEALYPQTSADQVMVSSETTLTQWINYITQQIPSDISITTYYNDGLKIATINSTDIKVPYLDVSCTGDIPPYTVTTNNGIPNFDWNVFSVDSLDSSKITLNGGCSGNQTAFGDNTNFVNASSIYFFGENGNVKKFVDIDVPIPKLTYSKDTINNRFLINVGLGTAAPHSSIIIPFTDISSIVSPSDYTLDKYGSNIRLKLGSTVISTVADDNTTYSVFTGASTSEGTAGLVPAPAIGDDTKFLKGNGTWATLPTYIANDGKLSLYTPAFSSQNTSFNGFIGEFTANQSTDNSLTLPYPELENSGKGSSAGVVRSIVKYTGDCIVGSNYGYEGGELRYTNEQTHSNEVHLTIPVFTNNSVFYPVETDAHGVAFVHIPNSGGGNSTIPYAHVEKEGSSAPYTYSSNVGGVKIGKFASNGQAQWSDTSYYIAGNPILDESASHNILINPISTTAGRYYAIETDSEGVAFVNVPWSSSGSDIPTASDSNVGGLKTGFSMTIPSGGGLRVGVALDETTSKGYIEIPDSSTIQKGLMSTEQYVALSYAIKYISQSLTSEQKAQARTNIGAGTSNFSGSYNDLSNKPTIPAAQIQSDWNQSDSGALDYIKNKPFNYTLINKEILNTSFRMSADDIARYLTSGQILNCTSNEYYLIDTNLLKA